MNLKFNQDQLKQELFLHEQDGICFIVMNAKINTCSKSFVRKFHDLLDIIQEQNTVMVTMSINPKVFNAGMNLKELIAYSHQKDRNQFVEELIELYGRLLKFPVPTIAYVSGAAIAGGCMLALSHDYRIFHESSFIQMNEIKINMHLPPGMNAVVQNRVTNKNLFKRIVLEAEKIYAKECLKDGIADCIGDFSEVYKLVNRLKDYNQDVFKMVKHEMNKNTIYQCFNKSLAPGVIGEWPYYQSKL